jgi:hypothetical protein
MQALIAPVLRIAAFSDSFDHIMHKFDDDLLLLFEELLFFFYYFDVPALARIEQPHTEESDECTKEKRHRLIGFLGSAGQVIHHSLSLAST